MARVIHREGKASHIGFGGKTYKPDAQGVFDVPEEAVAELDSHGFDPAPADQKAKGGGKGGGNQDEGGAQ